MNFHARMMNIPCHPEAVPGYKHGHRDARHVAAEIANEADALIAQLVEALGYWIADESMVDRSEEDIWDQHIKLIQRATDK